MRAVFADLASAVRIEELGLPISEEADTYRREYPQSSKAVGRARRDVVEFAKGWGFHGQLLDDIEGAVGEGLANAVEHGECPNGRFEVMVRYSRSDLVVEIKDEGNGFDHRAVDVSARPPVEGLRGFGTFIMNELMDDVRYSESGTRLRLLKRLPPAMQIKRSALAARSML